MCGPTRLPIPVLNADTRIGSTAVQIDPAKIVGIVISNQADSPSTVLPPDTDTQAIAAQARHELLAEIEESS